MNFMRDYLAMVEKAPEAAALHYEGKTYSHGELMGLIDGCGLALKKSASSRRRPRPARYTAGSAAGRPFVLWIP